MKYGKARQFDLKIPSSSWGTLRVKVYEEPMFSQDFRQENGSFPCVISPDAYREGKPHYWFDLYEDGQDIAVFCDLLYVDDEYDGFLVQAQHWYDDMVQVRIHSTHDTWYTPELVQDIGKKLRRVKEVLPLLDAALRKRLNLKNSNEVLQPAT